MFSEFVRFSSLDHVGLMALRKDVCTPYNFDNLWSDKFFGLTA